MMGLIFIVTITVLQVQMRVSTCFFFTCDICVWLFFTRKRGKKDLSGWI
jgi:hypothetical protein